MAMQRMSRLNSLLQVISLQIVTKGSDFLERTGSLIHLSAKRIAYQLNLKSEKSLVRLYYLTGIETLPPIKAVKTLPLRLSANLGQLIMCSGGSETFKNRGSLHNRQILSKNQLK